MPILCIHEILSLATYVMVAVSYLPESAIMVVGCLLMRKVLISGHTKIAVGIGYRIVCSMDVKGKCFLLVFALPAVECTLAGGGCLRMLELLPCRVLSRRYRKLVMSWSSLVSLVFVFCVLARVLSWAKHKQNQQLNKKSGRKSSKLVSEKQLLILFVSCCR